MQQALDTVQCSGWHKMRRDQQACGRIQIYHRKFIPDYLYPEGIKARNLEVERKPWTHLACPSNLTFDTKEAILEDVIIVYAHGICYGEDRSDIPESDRKIAGTFFSTMSPRNKFLSLTQPDMTKDKAELLAGLQSLRCVSQVLDEGEIQLRFVIIKSDSSYLCHRMTSEVVIPRHERANLDYGDVITQMDDQVQLLKGKGVEVLWWPVSREENKKAIEMTDWSMEAADNGGVAL